MKIYLKSKPFLSESSNINKEVAQRLKSLAPMYPELKALKLTGDIKIMRGKSLFVTGRKTFLSDQQQKALTDLFNTSFVWVSPEVVNGKVRYQFVTFSPVNSRKFLSSLKKLETLIS